MASFHQTILIGYLGSDPDVRHAPSGAMVATFRVACTDAWESNGQRQEHTEWYTCVAWRKLGERAQRLLRKGAQVWVRGKMKTRTWEDRNGGGKRSVQELQLDDFLLMGSMPEETREQEPREREAPVMPDHTPQGNDDDLPF